jgi:hypothetical protein
MPLPRLFGLANVDKASDGVRQDARLLARVITLDFLPSDLPSLRFSAQGLQSTRDSEVFRAYYGKTEQFRAGPAVNYYGETQDSPTSAKLQSYA